MWPTFCSEWLRRTFWTARSPAVMAVAGKTHFKSRTWKQVLDEAGMHKGLQEAALRWIAASGPAVKTRDALLLIDRLGETSSCNIATGTFLHTPFRPGCSSLSGTEC